MLASTYSGLSSIHKLDARGNHFLSPQEAFLLSSNGFDGFRGYAQKHLALELTAESGEGGNEVL